MKYFEFDKHGYWAMVAAEGEPTKITREQALKIYRSINFSSRIFNN